MPPLTRCQTQVKPVPDICDHPGRPEGCVALALVLPADVSMLPLTSAMQPIARYLNGPEAQERVEDKEMTASGGDTLQPIVSIFDAQPYRSGSGHEDMPEQFEALIVISRAVPRPTKVCVCMVACSPTVPSLRSCQVGRLTATFTRFVRISVLFSKVTYYLRCFPAVFSSARISIFFQVLLTPRGCSTLVPTCPHLSRQTKTCLASSMGFQAEQAGCRGA